MLSKNSQRMRVVWCLVLLEFVVLIQWLETETPNEQEVSDDIETKVSVKQAIRRWKRCLEAVSTLLSEGLVDHFSSVKEFLLQFRADQQEIQKQLERKLEEYEVTSILNICQGRLNRLENTMQRKNRRLSFKAKEQLENELVKLQGYEHNPLVISFLALVSPVITRFETTYQKDLLQFETEKKDKLKQNIEQVYKLKSAIEKETQELSDQIEKQLHVIKQDCDKILKEGKQ